MEKNLDQLIASIAQFNIPGWTNLTASQIKVTTIGDGYINTTCKVERSDNGQDGPRSVLVKKYGGNIFDDHAKDLIHINSPMIQSLIFHEQSSRGWGPKLYGLMDDGRVEEFVDCHTLTAEEAFTPEINRDLARALARFQSLDLPIRRTHNDILTRETLPKPMIFFIYQSSVRSTTFLAIFYSQCQGWTERVAIRIDKLDPSSCFRKFPNFPIEEEGNYIDSVRQRIK